MTIFHTVQDSRTIGKSSSIIAQEALHACKMADTTARCEDSPILVVAFHALGAIAVLSFLDALIG